MGGMHPFSMGGLEVTRMQLCQRPPQRCHELASIDLVVPILGCPSGTHHDMAKSASEARSYS